MLKMQKKYTNSKLKAVGLCSLLIMTSFSIMFFGSPISADQPIIIATGDDDLQHLIFKESLEKPLFALENHDEGVFTSIKVKHSMLIGDRSGSPVYPVIPYTILIPYGKTIKDIHVGSSSLIQIDMTEHNIDLLEHPIVPYQQSLPIGAPEPESIDFDESIYQSDEKVPDRLYTSSDVQYCRGYAIVTLNVFPMKYNPRDGEIFYYNQIVIDITLEDSSNANTMVRDNALDQAWVQSLVINPEETSSYTDISSRDPLEYPGGLCDPVDSYDYVIITRELLADYSGSYTWNDFINRKQSEGLQTILVTVEDIEESSDYWNTTSLFNDTPALIREFLRDAYQDWGLSYVLIAGDHEGVAGIPRRLMSSGAESNVEADLYWSNLDNSFNDDEDTSWGEEGDTGFDLYSELFIGSLTCDEGIDLSNWMTKSFYYADTTEKDYLENAAFYGGDTGWSCQGDDFMDFTLYGTDDYFGPYNETDFPDYFGFMQGFDTWNASNPGYEYNTSIRWTAEPPNDGWNGGSETEAWNGLKNAVNNDDITLLNAVAHADPYMSCDLFTNAEDDWLGQGPPYWEEDFHNTKPFFIHDYGCHCGDMDDADDGILHSMLFYSDTELAFACVYNTGYGWGNLDETNSSSAWQQKLFWEYLFNLSISGSPDNWQFGRAHAYGKDTLAPAIDWEDTFRENIQCSTFFGDPAQLLKIPYVPDHDILVTNLVIPSVIPHGETQTVSALVRNIGNNTETGIIVDFLVNDSVIDSTTISSLDKMESVPVDFPWDPAVGTYLVTVESQPIPDEYDLMNNFVNKTVQCVYSPQIEVAPLSLSLMLPTEATDSDIITITNLPEAETILDYIITYGGDLGGSWLSASPESESVAIGDSEMVTVTVDSTGLDEGDYTGYLFIASNDVDDPEVVVIVDITVVYGNDMAAVSVNSPVGTVVYGSYVVNATVQNVGYYPQSNVLVNCSIFEGGIGGTIINEDFSSNPTDWTITHIDGTSWTWDSSDERMENTYSGYPNIGYLDSPVLDCSGKTGISLSFWHYWKADYYSGDQNGYVRGSIDGGLSFPYVIDEFHHNDPAEETAVKSYDISSWANNQPQVMIRFDVENQNDWYWYMDNFNMSAEITGPLAYSSEALVNLPAYQSTYIEFAPNWDAYMGVYGIQITTLLAGDESPGNNVTAEVVYIEGPELSYDPTGYDAGMISVNTTDVTTFAIWNSGVGILTYSISESYDWIEVSPLSGDSTGEHDMIIVDIDTTELPEGPYHCDISISSNGGAGVFTVDMNVISDTTPLEDVNQSMFDRGFPIRHTLDGDWGAAQDFTPTMSYIPQVDIYLRKFGTPEFDLTVELREDDPEGTLLDSVVFPVGEIESSWMWLTVDFSDTPVESGTDYFIVLPPAPSGVSTSFGYEWGYTFGNQYDDGSFWFTRDGGGLWRDLPSMYDFTFKTYGLQ